MMFHILHHQYLLSNIGCFIYFIIYIYLSNIYRNESAISYVGLVHACNSIHSYLVKVCSEVSAMKEETINIAHSLTGIQEICVCA